MLRGLFGKEEESWEDRAKAHKAALLEKNAVARASEPKAVAEAKVNQREARRAGGGTRKGFGKRD